MSKRNSRMSVFRQTMDELESMCRTHEKNIPSYTPGPWEIDSHLPPNLRSVVAVVGGIAISGNTTGPHDPDQNCGNARLVSAAPELLEALESIVASKAISDESLMQVLFKATNKIIYRKATT